jgi:hypothetical protein
MGLRAPGQLARAKADQKQAARRPAQFPIRWKIRSAQPTSQSGHSNPPAENGSRRAFGRRKRVLRWALQSYNSAQRALAVTRSAHVSARTQLLAGIAVLAFRLETCSTEKGRNNETMPRTLNSLSLPRIIGVAVTAATLLLAGCSRAPSFNILGSFFPSWILCGVIGILLTIAARLLFVRIRLEEQLSPLILVYPCLAAFFTFSLWLLLFR